MVMILNSLEALKERRSIMSNSSTARVNAENVKLSKGKGKYYGKRKNS